MTDQPKLHKLEGIKGESRQLRGTIADELVNDESNFSGDAAQLLKHHGTYQQDDREKRSGGQKHFQFMVRTRIPGGRICAADFLTELDLCDDLGDGTLRITSRQGLQHHGIAKGDLKETIRKINETKLTTLAACGDVARNTMCCPAPLKNNPLHDQIQQMADDVAEALKPKTSAYYDIWLKDDEGGSERVGGAEHVEDELYGQAYLPRKFKIGIALPHDNCVDIYTQDLGLLAVPEGDRIIGYNVIVGGGMGVTPANKKTFAAVGLRMTFVPPEAVVDVAIAIVKVQRDHGNRSDRKQARMKYLIKEWGLEKFKSKVEEYYGQSLPEPHAADVTGVEDHMGWHEQGDGKWYLGVNVENGRIKDEGNLRLKSAFRAVLNKYDMETRLTALQSVILCDIEEDQKSDIESILREHGVPLKEDLSETRRYSMACPALPTCGLAITDSERVMPTLIDQFESALSDHGIPDERVSIHMTGCPNGCARPYTPEIGLVGKAKGKYTVYLGGNAEGTRLGFLYDDLVPFEEVVPRLSPLFGYFSSERSNGESFGDFCLRKGKEDLEAFVTKAG